MIKDWWKVVLGMALPLVKAAGHAKREEDSNDTGKDDLIGYTLEYVADLGKALLSEDTNAIQSLLNKTAPK